MGFFMGCPTDFPGPPWTVWTFQELPRVSLGFPGFPDVPETSPGPPWAAQTFQGLPRASLGHPDVPGGVARGSLKPTRFLRSPRDRHDRPYPSGQRSSGRASTPKACFGICSLVRNFCSRAPPRWSIMVGSESGKLVCWSYFVRHRAVSARQAPPEHSQTGSSQRHGGLGR